MSDERKKATTLSTAYRVLVSSTYLDMICYRNAMREAANNADCLSYGMERFGTNAVPTLEN